MDKTVIIYSTPTCAYCQMAKTFFGEHNVAFEEKNVAEDEAALKEAVQKSGQMGVPVIDIDGEIIVGFNKERVAELLDIK